MLKDSQGLKGLPEAAPATSLSKLKVTTNSLETLAAIDRFCVQSLGYGNDAEVILKAIAADPACAITHAHAAAYYLSWESTEARRQAAPYLKAAKKYLSEANEREQLYVLAISAWATGDIEQAIAYHEQRKPPSSRHARLWARAVSSPARS